MSENINHPAHYNQGGVECIEALKAATINKPPFEAVCVSNVIKYLWRYEEKGGIEDVEKAMWYINRLHKEIEEKNNTYKLVNTEIGLVLQSPWHTLMVPKVGDIFNQNESAREHLLNALLESGGYCPCQPQKSRDTMCPCRNYRMDNKCICGLFVKLPQVVTDNSVESESGGTDPNTEDGSEE